MRSNSRSLIIWRRNIVRVIRLREYVAKVRRLRQLEWRQRANMMVCPNAHAAGRILSRFTMRACPAGERARGKCYLII